MNAIESLEAVLDGLTGEITEKGWEGLDRYYKHPFRMYIGLLSILEAVDKEKGKKVSELAVELGILTEEKDG